jgi:hypothetical protein
VKNLMNFRWRATGKIFFISLNLLVLCEGLKGEKNICLHFSPFLLKKMRILFEHVSSEKYHCQNILWKEHHWCHSQYRKSLFIAFNSKIKALCSPSTSKSPLILFFSFTHETMCHKKLSYMRSIVVCWMGSIDLQ